MLNKQSLVYFRSEHEINADDLKSGLSPMGRLFLSDVISIDTAKDRKSFVFMLRTKKRVVLMQASGDAEREGWIHAIQGALRSEGEAEKGDPFRRTLRKLAPGTYIRMYAHNYAKRDVQPTNFYRSEESHLDEGFGKRHWVHH